MTKEITEQNDNKATSGPVSGDKTTPKSKDILTESEIKANSKIGRPSDLTPKVADMIVELLQRGNSISTTADIMCIRRETIHNWIKRGREHNSDEYETFFHRVARARSGARAAATQGILAAGVTDWKAWAWFLERTSPQEFGKVERKEISGPDGGPIPVIALPSRASSEAEWLEIAKAEKAISTESETIDIDIEDE